MNPKLAVVPPPVEKATTQEIKLLRTRAPITQAQLRRYGDGWSLRMQMGNQLYQVMCQDRGKPRVWRCLNRVRDYVEEHFGPLLVVIPPS